MNIHIHTFTHTPPPSPGIIPADFATMIPRIASRITKIKHIIILSVAIRRPICRIKVFARVRPCIDAQCARVCMRVCTHVSVRVCDSVYMLIRLFCVLIRRSLLRVNK